MKKEERRKKNIRKEQRTTLGKETEEHKERGKKNITRQRRK